MMITEKNYEAYLLDYLEGNLDEGMVNEFIEFLQQHPSIQEEVKDYKQFVLSSDDINFEGKRNLFKERLDIEEEFEMTASAFLDGELSSAEQEEFDAYLKKHPEKEVEINTLKNTRLYPSEEILFPKKRRLRKVSNSRNLILFVSKVAAVVILILAFASVFNNHKTIDVPESQLAYYNVPKQKKTDIPEPQDPKPKKQEVKEKSKTPEPEENKSKKSLRENSRGRVEDDMVAQAYSRDLMVVEPLKTLKPILEESRPQVLLADMSDRISNNESDYLIANNENLVGNQIKNKISLINFDKITKAGLNFASSISNNKFSYEVDKEGEVSEYNLDTRLLAFSIPSGKK